MDDERLFMARSFWPVGQGAFYTETFADGSVVVYDCGSKNTSVLKNIIQTQFCVGQKIDYVFISHMHDDHINGLPCLLERCDVQQVVLPYIYEKDKKYLKINSLLSRKKSQLLRPAFIDRMIDNPIDAIKRLSYKTNITFIMPSIEERRDELNKNWNEDQRKKQDELKEFENRHKNSSDIKIVQSGGIVGRNKWVYIPYNMQHMERIKTFSDLLLRETNLELTELSPTNLAVLLQNDSIRKRIKEIYEKFPGGLNTTSMVVYSGADKNLKGAIYYLYNHYNCRCSYEDQTGALYTGDYPAWTHYHNELKHFYEEHSNNIGLIQIPHHGDIKSFNSELIKPHRICIISAGTQNRYGHPSSNVIHNILAHRGNLFTVTEDPQTIVHIHIFLQD